MSRKSRQQRLFETLDRWVDAIAIVWVIALIGFLSGGFCVFYDGR